MAISGPGFEYPNLKTQALLRRKREQREEEIRREQRKTDAETVRSHGCRCIPCHPDSDMPGSGRITAEGESHAGWCPVALAVALEGKP